MRIFSNDVLFESKGSKESYFKNPIEHFRGTIVEVEINIGGLPDAEDSFVGSFWE